MWLSTRYMKYMNDAENGSGTTTCTSSLSSLINIMYSNCNIDYCCSNFIPCSFSMVLALPVPEPQENYPATQANALPPAGWRHGQPGHLWSQDHRIPVWRVKQHIPSHHRIKPQQASTAIHNTKKNVLLTCGRTCVSFSYFILCKRVSTRQHSQQRPAPP